MVELTDFCNLRCPMCDQSGHSGIHSDRTVHGYPKSFMKKKLVDVLIDSLNHRFESIGNLALFWQGESLIHPEIDSIFRSVLPRIGPEQVIRSFLLHTNGTSMTSEMITMLTDRDIEGSNINISMDASCAALYNRIRRGGDFEHLVRNVKSLISRKLSASRYHPVVHLQFIVMPENHADALDFYRMWSGFLRDIGCDYSVCSDFVHHPAPVCIYFRELQTGPEAPPGVQYETVLRSIERESGFSLVQHCGGERIQDVACPSAWYTPVISSDGSVTVCCLDMKLDYCLGNISNRTLFEIWNSDAAWEFRRTIAGKDFQASGSENTLQNPLLCRNCRCLYRPD